ncbi:MAG: hypothetical protein CL596_01980 [Alteromonas sp.]|nr:hypothetical protein [Alteromonas sp.]MAY23256.1 hypothetical protein [Flavobacteriaceae bacterium]|tara:strand:- start:35753 stop:36823 length:1071 start_codon:yes stop_codon:yes gene_type:complete
MITSPLKIVVTSILITLTGLFFSACSKDDDASNNNDDDTPQLVYVVTNVGNGGVTSINDGDDLENLFIVQSIPSVPSVSYNANLPLTLYFNDKILVPSIEDNILVTMNGEEVGGNIYINESFNGYAILTFTPFETYEDNSDIVFTLSSGVQDDGGNGLDSDYVFSYTAETTSNGEFTNNGSFENTSGIDFIGDGSILEGTQGCVNPVDGSKFAAITTGNQLISSGNAIGGTSSVLLLGPIENTFSSVSFEYNFLSSEFQEFVGSEYDDTATITVVGPDGVNTSFITSVNTVGKNNTQCIDFPNLPDDGDEYAGETGWVVKNVNGNVGTPAYLIITVTDVGDEIYSSALTVDNIAFN